MKKLNFIIILLIISVSFWDTVKAQPVDIKEATMIASKWIVQITDQKATWGAYTEASPGTMQVFKNNDRKLGYFCNVDPEGFIVVSIRRELAPVKAYSTHGQFDAALDEGIPGYLKTAMSRILDTLESVLGPIEQTSSADLVPLLEINYQDNWTGVENYVPGTAPKLPPPGAGTDNYQEGQVLLTTDWDQFPPYNDQCPYLGCTTTSNGRAYVGCVATAGAQIMRYWNWPPWGNGIPYQDTYDWWDMPNSITTSSPQSQIDAVAELNHEVGLAVAMNYGCDASGSYTNDMVNVFTIWYRYSSSCNLIYRPDYTAIDWFNLIKAQNNANRPIQYRIPGHSIVGDGWQEVGSPTVRQYHMNYGWQGTGTDMWYNLDAIQGGNPADEFIVRDIIPNTALGSFLIGSYPLQTFNHRYFDRDAWGNTATFYGGQWLHFLPNIKVSGNSSTGYVRFYGSLNNDTHMYTGGDWSMGIIIHDGCIRLSNYGGIKFY